MLAVQINFAWFLSEKSAELLLMNKKQHKLTLLSSNMINGIMAQALRAHTILKRVQKIRMKICSLANSKKRFAISPV